MSEPPPVLLLGPYPGDRLASIERYAACLRRELARHTEVHYVAPQPILGRFASRGTQKWLGYVDKLLLFPRQLRAWTTPRMVTHLCDQAAAVYAPQLRDLPHLLTCFDLIAIRSARDEFRQHSTRWAGRHLQRMILKGIKSARHVACISSATRDDLLRVSGICQERVSVVPLGLHTSFEPVPREEAERVIFSRIPRGRYIVHVGGNQWYKNRDGVLEIASKLPATVRLVLVGPPLTASQRDFVRKHHLDISCVSDCSDRELAAFYSRAELLLFPSHCEGFGWPVLEAQACGCPVVTARLAPMTDVGGACAEYFEAGNYNEAAGVVAALLQERETARSRRIQQGFENVQRFSVAEMISQYLNLYAELLPLSLTGQLPLAA